MADGAVTFDVIARDRASATLTKVGRETDNLSKRHIAFAAAGGAALGTLIGKVADFAKGSVTAYAEAQSSQVRLEDAYRRFPKLADAPIEKIRELAEAIQAKTGVDHNQIDSAAAVIAQFGVTGRQVQSLLPLIVDYAQKTGKDVPTAASALGKALLGNARGLKELGINFKATHDRQKDVVQITDLLRQKVGGFAAQEGKTAAGQAKILAASFNDVKERVGAALLPVLQTLVGLLNRYVIPAFSTVWGWLSRNRDIVIPLVAAVGGLIAGFKLYTAVTRIATAVQLLFNGAMEVNPIALVITAIAALVAGFVYLWTHVKGFRDFWIDAWNGIKTVLLAVWNNFLHPIFTVAAAVVKGIGDVVSWLWRNIFEPAWKGISIAVSGAWSVIKPVLKFLATTILTFFGGVVDGAAWAFGWIPGLGPKLREAARKFDEFRDKVNDALNGIQRTVPIHFTLSQALIGDAPSARVPKPGQSIFDLNLAVVGAKAKPKPKAHAAGGYASMGEWFTTGEEGPELMRFASPRQVEVLSGSQSRHAVGGQQGALLDALTAVRRELERNTAAVERIAPTLASLQRLGHAQSAAQPAR